MNAALLNAVPVIERYGKPFRCAPDGHSRAMAGPVPQSAGPAYRHGDATELAYVWDWKRWKKSQLGPAF